MTFSRSRDALRTVARKSTLISKIGPIGAVAILLAGAISSSSLVGDPSKMPIGDLPGWHQTYAQDFNVPAAFGQVGKIYGRDMRGYADFQDSSGKGVYSPDIVLSAADGKLDY